MLTQTLLTTEIICIILLSTGVDESGGLSFCADYVLL